MIILKSADIANGGQNMCVVKTGVEVKTFRDLQNLVTSSVLRQPGLFDEHLVNEYAFERLQGSVYESEGALVKDMIRKTLFLLSHSSVLLAHDNLYQINDISAKT